MVIFFFGISKNNEDKGSHFDKIGLDLGNQLMVMGMNCDYWGAQCKDGDCIGVLIDFAEKSATWSYNHQFADITSSIDSCTYWPIVYIYFENSGFTIDYNVEPPYGTSISLARYQMKAKPSENKPSPSKKEEVKKQKWVASCSSCGKKLTNFSTGYINEKDAANDQSSWNAQKKPCFGCKAVQSAIVTEYDK